MTVTAIPGPAINYGISYTSSGAAAEYNEERGPSLNDLGEGTLDPRPQFGYKPGNRVGVPVFGWPGCFGGPVVDFIPIALNTSGIAASFTSTGAAAITLQTSANSSSFRLISAFVPSTYPAGTTAKVLMLDGYQGSVAVGQGSTSPAYGAGCGFGQGTTQTSSAGSIATPTVNLWNPLVMGGRCLTISNFSTNTSDANNTYVINGFDVYGMAMSATLVGATAASTSGASVVATTVTTQKAFKYIISTGISVTGSTGSSQVFIGTADTFGFPLYVDHPSYATIWIGPSSAATVAIGASNTHTFGYGSSLIGVVPGQAYGSSLVALSSGPDVRGTYASSLATTGNTLASGSTGMRVTMNISPRVSNLVTVGITSTVSGLPSNWGLVGLPQV